MNRSFAVAVLVLCASASVTPAFAQARQQTLVMPFENVTRDSHIFWLSEASAVLLADELNTLGTDAITRDERRRAFERLQVPPAASLTDATVIRIGQLVGASDVVVGSLQLEGDALVVHARSIALEPGRIKKDVTVRGPIAELFDTFERLARQIAPASLRTTEDVRREHPPLPAFENYIKGLLADSSDTAVNYLNAALKLYPEFDRARLALWEAYEDQGEYARAADAALSVPAASALGRHARFLATLSQIELKKYDEAFAALKGLADTDATAPVLNNLGVIQLRRGATPQGSATYYFNKAAETDRNEPDYFFNLGYGYWVEHDPQASIYWLREALRRNPADGDAHFVLATALAAGGNATEAARERELARRLSSVYQEWEKRPASDPVPRGLERLKRDVDLPRAGLADVVVTTEQQDQKALARFYVERGRRLYEQDRDREAIAELNRALFLSPYEPEGHLLVGRIHMRAGQVREAIDSFKISIWSADTAEAHVALAEAYLDEKEWSSAMAEAERALALDPSSSSARKALERARAGR